MGKTRVDHERWMAHCLELARQAGERGEVPIAAALVKDNVLIADAYNQPISSCDPSAHAEILAMRKTATALQNYRLPGCTLYVTVEPCSMCAGALVHARVAQLVFGAAEPRAGAVISQQRLLDADWLNHRVAYQGGVLAEPCAQLMRDFFAGRRTVADARS